SIYQRNIQSILPNTSFTSSFYSVLMPSRIWSNHKIVYFEHNFVSVHNSITTFAFHNKTQGRSFVTVSRSKFSRASNLNTSIEPPHRSTYITTFVVYHINHSAPCLLRSYQFQRF